MALLCSISWRCNTSIHDPADIGIYLIVRLVCCGSVWGHAVAQLVDALRYKPEGRRFDWNVDWHNLSGCTVARGSIQCLTEMSIRNISWGYRRPVGRVDKATSYPDCLEICEPPGILRACPRLYRIRSFAWWKKHKIVKVYFWRHILSKESCAR